MWPFFGGGGGDNLGTYQSQHHESQKLINECGKSHHPSYEQVREILKKQGTQSAKSLLPQPPSKPGSKTKPDKPLTRVDRNCLATNHLVLAIRTYKASKAGAIHGHVARSQKLLDSTPSTLDNKRLPDTINSFKTLHLDLQDRHQKALKHHRALEHAQSGLEPASPCIDIRHQTFKKPLDSVLMAIDSIESLGRSSEEFAKRIDLVLSSEFWTELETQAKDLFNEPEFHATYAHSKSIGEAVINHMIGGKRRKLLGEAEDHALRERLAMILHLDRADDLKAMKRKDILHLNHDRYTQPLPSRLLLWDICKWFRYGLGKVLLDGLEHSLKVKLEPDEVGRVLKVWEEMYDCRM